MKHHNRNGSRNHERYKEKKAVIAVVERLLSDLFFYNIPHKSEFYVEMNRKLKTQVVRSCGDDIDLSGDMNRDMRMLKDKYFDKQFLEGVVNSYGQTRIKDKYDSKHIVECTNLKRFIEKLFDVKLDLAACGLDFDYDVYCPCGEKTIYREDARVFNSDIFEDGRYAHMYRSNRRKYDTYGEWTAGEYKCPACGKRCFTHMGTKIPYGMPADRRTRSERNKIHALIDELCDSRERRRSLYIELAYTLGISVKDMHVGNLDYDDCQKVVDYINERYKRPDVITDGA